MATALRPAGDAGHQGEVAAVAAHDLHEERAVVTRRSP